MRSRVAVAAAGLLLAVSSLPVANARQPGAEAAVAQGAFAAWMVESTKTGGVAYFVDVIRGGPTQDGISTLAFVGKMRCTTQRGRGFTVTICMGMARPIELGLHDFKMDPLLNAAEVVVRHRGAKHEVTWTGQGPMPQIVEAASVDEGGVAAMVGMGRYARASGTVFGKKVETGRHDFGVLAQEAHAAASATRGLTRTTLSDGRVRFEWRVRTAR